jgi:hypothetical protein
MLHDLYGQESRVHRPNYANVESRPKCLDILFRLLKSFAHEEIVSENSMQHFSLCFDHPSAWAKVAATLELVASDIRVKSLSCLGATRIGFEVNILLTFSQASVCFGCQFIFISG